MTVNKKIDISNVPFVNILGVEIHDVSYQETVEILKNMVQNGQPHHVMTVNPEFVMMAQNSRAFFEILQKADLKVADGIGILLGARILGTSIRERVTGVDIVRRFAATAQENGFRIFLLGAAPGIAEQAAAVLQKENPGLQIAGTYSGSPRPEDEEMICSMIEKTRPHILFVAYGPPQQDLWIARTQQRLMIPVAMGVGGTFDFLTGVAVRAPLWIRRIGMEWLFRLIREPWRWKRQMSLPLFVLSIIWKRMSQKNIQIKARS
jgi:N-acetylglucosaminyldiphosphoundecaprenol N-acetyl-beta-D-mannosaminyltransferase